LAVSFDTADIAIPIVGVGSDAAPFLKPHATVSIVFRRKSEDAQVATLRSHCLLLSNAYSICEPVPVSLLCQEHAPASPVSPTFLDVVIDELAQYNPLLDAESVESHYGQHHRRLTKQG
jgi:hypothetical protein